jgi:hypothetical protein
MFAIVFLALAVLMADFTFLRAAARCFCVAMRTWYPPV